MIPRTYNFKQWRNLYYHVCWQAGISRKASITSNSLQQPERLNETYQAVAAQANPTEDSLETSVTKQLDLAACQEAVEVVNHSHLAISGVYLDSAK